MKLFTNIYFWGCLCGKYLILWEVSQKFDYFVNFINLVKFIGIDYNNDYDDDTKIENNS